MPSLQWGRDLEVAERKLQPISRTDRARASMGPRLGSRGKWRTARVIDELAELQWGRDLEVAESGWYATVIYR